MADNRDPNQTTPRRTKSNRSLLLACVALGLMGLLFVGLGNWQLDRAKERRSIAQAIEAGRQAPAVRLTPDSDAGQLQPWQTANATGRWLTQWSILIENRSFEGRPGLWLATPLQISESTALLVLRGWVPRPIGDLYPFETIRQSQQTVSVSGEVAKRVPRLYELGQEPALSPNPVSLGTDVDGFSALDLNRLPRRQNLSADEMSDLTGLQFLSVVLLQTDTTDGSQLERGWPTPSIDANTNVGYAIQWFSFAAIAFGALGVLLWRHRRREKISAK